MTATNCYRKLPLRGIALGIMLISIVYFLLPPIQHPILCTINQTRGEPLVIDETFNNAVICTKINNSVILKVPLWVRVGGEWHISNSSGLLVSEGEWNMPNSDLPDFGSIEWKIVPKNYGVYILNATCERLGNTLTISSVNLTFVVT